MSKQFDVSVVISTYNRCEMLPEALESVLGQDAGGVRYEVIIVDNNSTDRTREVVESIIKRGNVNIRYVFEGRQGLSHGRNAGINSSQASIIAFTDDDVRAERDWVASIKHAFDDHPEVDFISGKVLPRWEGDPPSWLTSEIWDGPLALADRGDKPLCSNAQRTLFCPGANFSFRREVFEQVGQFDPRFQGVKGWVSSIEDAEFILRLWRAGKQGLYLPNVVVVADVQPERMTKQYFRRWHTSRGRYWAMMRLGEIITAKGALNDASSNFLTLFGTPAHIYRELLFDCGRYVASTALRRETQSLRYECQVRNWVNYISQRYEEDAAERKGSKLAEALTFVRALVRKKASRNGVQ